MRIACARWDDDGRMYRPRWDGSAWRWYLDEKFTTEVQEPDDATRVHPTPAGFSVRIYCYNDDGSSPDPRPGRDYVTKPLLIASRTSVGRERTAAEVEADIDHWIDRQPDQIMADVARVTARPRDLPGHELARSVRPSRDTKRLSRRA